MTKPIDSLNFQTDVDILYLYLNLKKYLSQNEISFSTIQKEIRIKNDTMGFFCLSAIEKEILEEMGDSREDSEIIYIYKQSNKDDDINAKETNLTTKDISIDNVFIKNLSFLLSPLIFSNSKACVDLIAYVYKKTGISHFPFLLETFQYQQDLLIELYLLKSNLDSLFNNDSVIDDTKDNATISSDHFDLKEIERVVSEKTKILEGEKIDTETDGKDDDSKVDDGKVDDGKEGDDSSKCINTQIKLKDTINLNTTKDTIKLNTTKDISKKSSYLIEAKTLLLDMPLKDQKFFIENCVIFLQQNYDSEIFRALLSVMTNNAFFPCAHRLDLPNYLYKYINMHTMIHLDVPITPYTLKYFLEYFIATKNNVLTNAMGYSLISRRIFKYFQYFDHHQNNLHINDNLNNITTTNNHLKVFLYILNDLINNKVERMASEIHRNLFRNIDQYLMAFYRAPYKDNQTLVINGNNKSLSISPEGSQYSNHLDNIKELAGIIVSDGIGTENDNSLTINGIVRDYEGKIQPTVNSDDINSVIYSMYKTIYDVELDYLKIFDDFVVKFSENHKMEFLLKLADSYCKDTQDIGKGDLKDTQDVDKSDKDKGDTQDVVKNNKDTQGKDKNNVSNWLDLLPSKEIILKNLREIPKSNWRYKKFTIENIEALKEYGFSKESFEDDRNYYIRHILKE